MFEIVSYEYFVWVNGYKDRYSLPVSQTKHAVFRRKKIYQSTFF